MVTIQKLAKDIGIPAQALLERLLGMGFQLDNIESVLTQEQETKARTEVDPATLTEQRVNRKIIRRRRREDIPREEVQVQPEKKTLEDEVKASQERKKQALSEQKKIDPKKAAEDLFKKKEEIPQEEKSVKPQEEVPAPEVVSVLEKEKAKDFKPVSKVKRSQKVQEIKASEVRLEDFKRKVKVFFPRERKVVNIRTPKKTQITTPKATKRVIKVDESMTVGQLASELKVKTSDLITKLMKQGMMLTVNDPLDFDTISLIASEYGHEVQNIAFKEEEVIKKVEDKAEELQPRPPVVTIMGHVDHGKTTLLDVVRQSHVAQGEAGGITQHIGAYQVEIKGKKITFIDTPGHAAFAAMRSRGAQVTDIVVLVVAADDGIMPQTKEARAHAKAAGVPIIVAINKIDKPGAKIENIKKQLTELELVPEEWGGTTLVALVSAVKKQGIQELLEMILLQAEMLELKSNPDKKAEGVVLESRLDPKKGSIVTLLIYGGTLRASDYVVAGNCFGKIRSMKSDAGKTLKVAPPSTPVEILGLSGSPEAGEEFHAVEDASKAKELIDYRIQKEKEESLKKGTRKALEDLLSQKAQGEAKELRLIIKADVRGSLEALTQSIEKLEAENVKVEIIQSMVGGINENDVHLAMASNAMIIGFHVRPEGQARRLAEEKGVLIKTYRIIYEVLDDIKGFMEGLLEPAYEEEFIGRAEVRNVFNVSKVGTIAGCHVTEGMIKRGSKIRLLRENVIIHEGKLQNLKRFKDDAREVQSGYECGMNIENFNDIKVGDIIEAFDLKEVKVALKPIKEKIPAESS
ncbi:MAG: translation initiation factor IF-2 [Deltaproteobacteria bacterium]|nr:translation initiation factor IF-2 [Deltaproteobacteria bacterium]